ncbi:MAG: YchJ family protein [Marinobacter sp.]|uniref:YchJ family protein n=1 Tax=Marinobacter sp. TaxID=50741 RepID=UPI0034A067D1
MTDDFASTLCPCGSRALYAQCCQPLHQGESALSPETLMRSRYAAFVLNLPEYILTTWHPRTRPGSLSLEDSPDWVSLQILNSTENGEQGTVHFRANYRLAQSFGFLEERSNFLKENGHWYYLQGETSEGQFKPGRNETCPCGSGRKYKTCCHK